MYSKHNEVKSEITERFIKTLKAKIYKKMIASDNNSYLSYLNKFVDQHNNTYNHSIGKKTINAGYSSLNDKIETNPEATKFKSNARDRITKYKNIFSEG